MDKKTQTWLELAEEDLKFAGQIIQNKQRPSYALFFCHQSVEKLLKAVIQQITKNPPPRSHNLELLLQLTEQKLPSDKMKIIIDLAPHYITTRYPDDLAKHQKKYSQEFVSKMFDSVKELFLWIKNHWVK